MSAVCLVAAGKSLLLTTGLLGLVWTHSVEKVEWRETWTATPAGLELVEARVKGSGAGMEPGPEAHLVDGWWVWRPARPALHEIVLARSGATADWRLCPGETCRTAAEILGRDMDGEPVRLVACD